MYVRTALAFAFALVSTLASAADARDPLVRARQLYNRHEFDAALVAADEARRVPERADAADLIAARAYLERFRQGQTASDLVAARERLRRLDPQKFTPHERVEFIVGLGETLFFEKSSGAAAAVFESVLTAPGELPSDARDSVLDWWASALDQEARARPDIERQSIYQRVRDRMAEELGVNASSGPASDRAAAAARGQGDLKGAWDAAQAGWVRASLTADHGVALRGDLDQLVEKAIVPERARILGTPPETLKAEWQRFKTSWTK